MPPQTQIILSMKVNNGKAVSLLEKRKRGVKYNLNATHLLMTQTQVFIIWWNMASNFHNLLPAIHGARKVMLAYKPYVAFTTCVNSIQLSESIKCKFRPYQIESWFTSTMAIPWPLLLTWRISSSYWHQPLCWPSLPSWVFGNCGKYIIQWKHSENNKCMVSHCAADMLMTGL